MTSRPILLAGGTGVVGRPTTRWFRRMHPATPLLIGGRDMRVARELSREVGQAEEVTIDLRAPALGIDDDLDIAAVVMTAPDDGLRGLRLALERRVPYVNIGTPLTEVGPEVAWYAHDPAIPVVLASHWWGGAATFVAVSAASGFDTVRSVRVGALLDRLDPDGPTAREDMERAHASASASLAIMAGNRSWLTGSSSQATFPSVDGREMAADAFSSLDIASIHAATGADDVRFDLVTDESSSSRRGDAVAAELVVELEGEVGGHQTGVRSTLEFPHGQASLTGLGTAITVAAVLGLGGRRPAQPGIYFPELLVDAPAFLDVVCQAGAILDTRTLVREESR